MYQKRIRDGYRRDRNTVMVELDRIPLRDVRLLTHVTEVVLPGETFLRPVFSLYGHLGVGVLSLWLTPSTMKPLEQILVLRNCFEIAANVLPCHCDVLADLPSGDLTDVPTLVARLLKGLRQRLLPPDYRREPLRVFARKAKDLHGNRGDAISFSSGPEAYPIFHLIMEEFSGEDIQGIRQSEGRVLRALVTGDKNWDVKKDEVVTQLVSHDYSTRDSIIWLTHSEGSLKIYSKDMSTSVLTSKVLISFELEIVVAMKHFLHGALSKMSHAGRTWAPSELLTFRNAMALTLHQFYNLDVSGKDTTITRLESFKRELHVDQLQAVMQTRFDQLNALVSSSYAERHALWQDRMTASLGGFAAATVATMILFRLSDKGIGLNDPVRDGAVGLLLGLAVYSGIVLWARWRK
jgi:hypothetical protein